MENNCPPILDNSRFLSATQVMQRLGISRYTFYRALPQLRAMGLKPIRLFGRTKYTNESVNRLLNVIQEQGMTEGKGHGKP